MSIGYFSDELCDDLTRYMKKTPPEGTAFFGRLRKRLQSHAIHFKLPENGYVLPDSGDSVLIATDFLKPPFPVTVIEYAAAGGELKPDEFRSSKRLVMAVEERDSVVLFAACFKDDKRAWIPPLVYFRFYYGKEISLSRTQSKALSDDILAVGEAWDGLMGGLPLEQYAAMELKNLNQELSVYMDFCKALAEYDTEFADHRPDAETARKRRLRGKKPLYTYKVITITGKRRVSEVGKGGTHASPVAHLRRGHWRTYKSGVRGWVNAMMINGTNGIVVKDYKVESRHE